MEFEKYTDRAKGFLQSAQTMALRRGHQRLTPEHLLKVLLEDSEGLVRQSDSRRRRRPEGRLAAVDAELDRLPRRSRGPARGRSTCRPNWRASSSRPSNWRRSAGDSFVTVERLLLALAAAAGTGAAKALAAAGSTAQSLNRAIEEVRKGRKADSRVRRGRLRRAQEIRPRPDRAGARGQARPGHRPRRGDPPHHPGAVAPHQEQSGADRRAGGRQDRDRRGAGAAHRQRRRAGEPQRQEAPGARSRRADRRRQIPRRVRGAAEGGACRRSPRPPARSSSSSTSCTRWSAPARPKGRWTPPTC